MCYAGTFASPFDDPRGAERSVVVSSISKSHMLPGFRAGWCVGPEPFIERLIPLSEMMLFGAQPFIEDAAAVAVAGEFEECRFMVETFRRRAAAFTGPPRRRARPALGHAGGRHVRDGGCRRELGSTARRSPGAFSRRKGSR